MEQKNDDLRNRFTAWMVTVVKRTRFDFLRKLQDVPKIVSLDEISESSIIVDNFDDFKELNNQKLKYAIAHLSVLQQEVLKMLFVDSFKPYEVAKKLGRTEQYIYNLRYRILKKIKELMGDKDDQ